MTNAISLAFFESRLRIDQNSIDREVIEHAELFWHVSEEAAKATSRAVAAKEELNVVEAQLYKSISLEKEESGGRVTEAVIKNDIITHHDRKVAFEAYQNATLDAAGWAALRESFASRGYMLRDLCQLAISGFLSTEAVRGGGLSKKSVDVDSIKDRAAKKRTKWVEE